MATHPYISGAGNITQMIGFLRKNFPATVNSDTVRKLGVAPKNESYVINALQFIGVIDEEGKRTVRGQEILTTHDEEAFKKSFESLIRDSYKDLFDLRGDDVWTMSKDALIGYFRSADKTSEVIGTRQASLFRAFRTLAGHEEATAVSKSSGAPKSITKAPRPNAVKAKEQIHTSAPIKPPVSVVPSKKDMALTVRIEINLPAEASAETYDNIFKSIKANLLND
ncbi:MULTISPECIES: DUF5343 domain-containing protein [unclassified Inquilinus]|uniref:DUF5343 domain-containing protein n=1 Tax=unclassified Inquilinus TaxID=2645927 RepID=UPI003F8DED43